VILNSTTPQIAAYVRENAGNDNIFQFSNSAMATLLGPVVYDKNYDPAAVKGIVDELMYFAELFTKYTNPEMQRSSRYYSEMLAFQGYLQNYIDYWGTFADSAYPPLSSWNDYQQRLRSYQSYQVNSILQSIYTKSVSVLKDIPEVMLTDDMKKKRDNYAASLGDKVAILSMSFTDNTQKMLSAWSRLPGDADDAFKTLQAETQQGLKDTYMTAYSAQKELSVGWWNDFTMNGFNILSNTYYQGRLSDFQAKVQSWKAYPLCADSPATAALTQADLESAAWLLAEMGVTEKDDPATDAVTPLFHQNLFRGIRARQWAQTVYQIASAAADSRKPLTWTVYQPPVEMQRRLLDPGRLLATNRFRYVEASTGPTSQRFLTDAAAETALVKGTISEGLMLRFYLMSTDSSPTVTADFTGPWALLGLYLRPGSVTGSDGQRYVPVVVNDQSGSYIYPLRVAFSSPLPGVDQWYRLATWPDFQITSGGVEGLLPTFPTLQPSAATPGAIGAGAGSGQQ